MPILKSRAKRPATKINFGGKIKMNCEEYGIMETRIKAEIANGSYSPSAEEFKRDVLEGDNYDYSRAYHLFCQMLSKSRRGAICTATRMIALFPTLLDVSREVDETDAATEADRLEMESEEMRKKEAVGSAEKAGYIQLVTSPAGFDAKLCYCPDNWMKDFGCDTGRFVAYTQRESIDAGDILLLLIHNVLCLATLQYDPVEKHCYVVVNGEQFDLPHEAKLVGVATGHFAASAWADATPAIEPFPQMREAVSADNVRTIPAKREPIALLPQVAGADQMAVAA